MRQAELTDGILPSSGDGRGAYARANSTVSDTFTASSRACVLWIIQRDPRADARRPSCGVCAGKLQAAVSSSNL